MRRYRYMMIMIICALGGWSTCDPVPNPACGPNGSTVRTALTTVQIAGYAATIGVAILESQGTMSPPDAATTRAILAALSAATDKSLIEAGSNDDEKACYVAVAKNYADVLPTIPGAPPAMAAQIKAIIDLIDTVLNLVGTAPPPRMADTHLSHESTPACFEGEVQS